QPGSNNNSCKKKRSRYGTINKPPQTACYQMCGKQYEKHRQNPQRPVKRLEILPYSKKHF
ncbi:hypothetical protein, partial [Vibrio alginolyticus]|uniref:hypothetical protein n=1 Tax=Vibrio alginolyticus TaxID=663 RepID=UPI001A8C24E8